MKMAQWNQLSAIVREKGWKTAPPLVGGGMVPRTRTPANSSDAPHFERFAAYASGSLPDEMDAVSRPILIFQTDVDVGWLSRHGCDRPNVVGAG